MNKIKGFIFITLFFGTEAFSQTVRDAIQNIEKKEKSIPRYKNQKVESRDRIKVRIGKPINSLSTIFPDGSVESEYERKLNQEIAQLHKLSKRLNDGDTKRRILLKLAKSYSEKAALADRKAQDNYEKQLKLYLAGSVRSKPVLNSKAPRQYSLKAVKIYKQYIRNYKSASDADEVLFFLGYNYMSLGDVNEGIKYYKSLSSKFPKSEYVGDANLSLGDYYFDKDRRSSAKVYYGKVLSSGRSGGSTRNLATYKMAWLNHKMGDHNEALKNIIKVIKFGDAKGTRNRKNILLAEEALKDLPVFYAEAGDPKRAFTYFTNLMNGQKAYNALEKLAYYYVDRGQREEAQYLFSKLIQMDPKNQKSFDYQYSLVNMQASTGRNDLYERELYKWVAQFGPDSSWAKSTKDQKKKKEALDKAESALRSHVLKLHSEARDKKSKNLQLRADKGYALYLKTFKNSSFSDEMQFYYGELLYELGGYKESYMAYKKVGGKQYQKKAELNAVLALEKVIPTDEEIRKKVGQSTKELPLNENEQEFVSAANNYLEDPKNQEQRPEIKYRLASIYYSHNFFDRSEDLFKEIIKEEPNSKYAKYASDLILDSYKLRGDYAGLESAGRELVKIGSTSGSSAVQVNKVKSLVEQSAFKNIENRATSSAPEALAKEFLNFAKSYPDSALKNKALYNAGINFEKANDLENALSAYSLVSKSGDKDIYLNAQKFSALILENTGRLALAAQRYEEIGDMLNKPTQRAKYLSNAAVLREAFNSTTAMERIFAKLKSVDKPKDVYMYNYRLAEVYRRIGNTNQELKKRIEFFNEAKAEPFLLVNAARRIADIYDDKNINDKANYWYRAADLTYKKFSSSGASKASSSAARAKFKLSDKIFYDFIRVEIPKDQQKQAAAITKKLSMIDKINSLMQEVINYDDGYTIVSALNRLGQSYQHLTYSILNAPLPSGLTPEEIKQVEQLLKQKVEPFKKNAVASYKKSLEKAEKLETYNEDSLTTILELSKIDSDYAYFKYPYISDDTYMPYDKELLSKYRVDESDFLKPEAFVLDKYSKVLSQDKDDTTALVTLAVYYSLKRMTGVSNIFLEKTTKGFNKTAEYFNLKAYNDFTDNEPKVAVQNLKTALEINAGDVSAAANLASYFISYGGYSIGGRYLSRVYPAKSDSFFEASVPSVTNNFGISLVAKGSVDEAFAEFKSAEQQKSNFLPAVGNIAILNKVAKNIKNENNPYLGLYKKLAKTQGDFDRIKQMERD